MAQSSIQKRKPAQYTEPMSLMNADSGLLILLFWAVHIPLGPIFRLGPSILPTLHGLAVLAIGLYWVFAGKSLVRIAYAGAYIAGAEVLWRMNGASLFWEYGKYAVILLFGLSLLRNKNTKFPVLVTLYFLLLVPALIPTIMNEGIIGARRAISFNMSGPLAILMCAWFFSQLRVSREQLTTLFAAAIGPIIAIAALVLYEIVTRPQIVFTAASNFATSGGYGPNQVSTVLGLGALLAALSILLRKKINLTQVAPQLFISGWLMIQSILTFSRGGIYGLILSFSAMAIYKLSFDRSALQRTIFVLAIGAVLIRFIAFPALNSFTGGALEERFIENAGNTTGRIDIILTELDLFFQNPFSGVGVNMSKEYKGIAAHTEFSRALAEHGILGFLSYVILGIALFERFRKAPRVHKSNIIALASLGLFTMLHAALRLVTAPFVIGLAFVVLLEDEQEVLAEE